MSVSYFAGYAPRPYRVAFRLTEDEYTSLLVMAEEERRKPEDQCAYLVRRALEAAGLAAPYKPPYAEAGDD